MSTIEREIDYKGMSIKIYYDEDAESPANWDNPDCFLCADYRYLNVNSESISAEDCRNAIEETNRWFLNGFYIFPVSIYDHSGICIHLGTTRGWDYTNGDAFICVKRRKGWTWAKKQAEKVAQSVVDEWNMYLTGEVYGFVAEDEDGEHIDSCWGFYGDEGIEDAIRQAEGAIDYELEKRHEENMKAFKLALSKHIAKRKGQILAHTPLVYRTAFAC